LTGTECRVAGALEFFSELIFPRPPRNFLWHTSCDESRVARKFDNQSFAPLAASAAAVNLRMASFQLASIGAPPRVQRVHQPRRRLSVQSFPQAPEPVKIRHTSQNLGSVTEEFQVVPVQCTP
jgi:hypothetical protein